VATGVWLAGGLVGSVAYGAILGRPRWRIFAAERPEVAKGVKKVVGYGAAWMAVKKLLGGFVGKVFVIAMLGWEAYTFYSRQQRRSAPVKAPSSPQPTRSPRSASSTSATPASPPTAVADDTADEAGGAEAERWARQVKEEMLKNSLLRAGRKGAGVERSRAEDEVAGEADGEGGEGDMPDLVEV